MIGRRAVLGGLCALGGCGFRPVYGSAQPGGSALHEVYVDIIANRSGQLLRQAIQTRLDEGSGDAPKRFTLRVSLAEQVQGLDVQADNSTSRNRVVSAATWTLTPADNGSTKLAGGTVRSVDGYNVIDEQFFYSDLEQDATQRRQATALADQIALSLGLYFDKHPPQVAPAHS